MATSNEPISGAELAAVWQKFNDMEKLLDERAAAADKAVDKALASAEKAVDQRASTLDREFHEHLEQVRHENALAFVNSDKAVQAALMSQKEAVTKAEAASEKRFEAVNEFRAQLNDQARTFVARPEHDAEMKHLGGLLSTLTDRVNVKEGKGAGIQASWGILIAGAGLIATVLGIVIILANVLTAKG